MNSQINRKDLVLVKKNKIKKIKYTEIVKEPYSQGAITRDDFPGFREDYLAIHSILRRYQPSNILEIGTSTGSGTNIICNAMGVRKGLLGLLFDKSRVISMDVPPGSDPSIIYPDKEDGHPDQAGKNCNFPYTQLLGSSIEFNFERYYPIDAWFIDGKHDYKYCSKDTKQAIKSKPSIIIWHDIQIKEVHKAVVDVMKSHPQYFLYRVGDTRVAFAIKNQFSSK